jgi:2,3-bisphosphoglycerate-dependent phosphoglycerate mutase
VIAVSRTKADLETLQAQMLLVRHCDSTGQAPDAPLTPEGSAQAEVLAQYLSAQPVDQIFSSPYLRARATIEPFAARAGLSVRVHEGLVERRLSPEPIAHWREVVRRGFLDPAYRIPGGESAAEALERGWNALLSILLSGHRLPLAVSHGQLLSLVFQALEPGFGFEAWQSLSFPDVHLLEGPIDGPFTFKRVWS